jgi:hypothetical protein
MTTVMHHRSHAVEKLQNYNSLQKLKKFVVRVLHWFLVSLWYIYIYKLQNYKKKIYIFYIMVQLVE